MENIQKNFFREIDLFDFTSFLAGTEFLKKPFISYKHDGHVRIGMLSSVF